MSPAAGLSIIVPALDEAPRVAALARHLAAVVPEAERILVDGGSSDRTVEAAVGFRVLSAERGRASQMNAGAAAASGDTLLFLHADTALPVGAGAEIARCLAGGAAVGAFSLRLDGPGLALRLTERGARLRCRWLGVPLGDQALFCARETFEALGGFAPLPMLEDLDFVRRAAARGPVVTLDAPILTSARVWGARGAWRTMAWNGWVTARALRGWRPREDRRGLVR